MKSNPNSENKNKGGEKNLGNEAPVAEELSSGKGPMELQQFFNRRARTGIELIAEPGTARRGCLVGHVKSFEAQSETITSSLWTSLHAKSLLRPKNRSPFPVRCSLGRRNVAASKQSGCCQSASGGECVGSHAPRPKGEACNSVTGEAVSDRGSTPLASTLSAMTHEHCGSRGAMPAGDNFNKDTP